MFAACSGLTAKVVISFPAWSLYDSIGGLSTFGNLKQKKCFCLDVILCEEIYVVLLAGCEFVSFLVVLKLYLTIIPLWIILSLIDGADWFYFVMWFYSHSFWLFIGYLKLIDFYFI